MTRSHATLISILSLSAVAGVATMIAGIIPQLHAQYPQITITGIEWVVTIANLAALATLAVNPSLTRRFGVRLVVVAGLLLSAGFGALPLVPLSYLALIGTRIGLGLGIGLFSPHAISLIAHVYHGERRAKLLGMQTGISALGNAALLGLASLVIAWRWQNSYGLYLVLLPVAWLAWRYLPNVSQTPASTKQHLQLSAHTWRLCGLAFVTYLLIWGVQLKLATLFAAHHVTNAAGSSATLAAMNIGGLLAGLSFGWVHQRLGAKTLTMGYAGAALTVVALLFSSQATLAITAALGFNFIYSFTGPYLVFAANHNLPAEQIDQVSSLFTMSTIMSAFFAPPVFNAFAKLGMAIPVVNSLGWIAIMLAGLAVGSAFVKK